MVVIMRQLEVGFSEEDVREALETYLNRHLLPHRQVQLQNLRISPNVARMVSAVASPRPDELPAAETSGERQ